eukprot:1394727-Amphidinium_carterae.1
MRPHRAPSGRLWMPLRPQHGRLRHQQDPHGLLRQNLVSRRLAAMLQWSAEPSVGQVSELSMGRLLPCLFPLPVRAWRKRAGRILLGRHCLVQAPHWRRALEWQNLVGRTCG